MALQLDRIGPWSEIKLKIVKKYAAAYSLILTKKGFHHTYIDAFAGAGIHIRKGTDDYVLGSPWNACDIKDPFDKYIFVDLNSEKTEFLKRVRDEAPDRDIDILSGDCNQILPKDVFPLIGWTERKRALCMLDPYGLHLDWEVIKAAGEQKTIEIFLNFPVMDMNMNVLWRNNPKGVAPEQVERMNRFWGDSSWNSVAYEPDPEFDLFEKNRKVKVPDSNSALVKAFQERLKSVAGFRYVPKPIPMRNTINREVYYLFFASPNDTGGKIVRDIFRKYRD